VVRMGEITNTYWGTMRNQEEKRPLGKPIYRWDDNIKTDLTGM
jgi:hypothetical protein